MVLPYQDRSTIMAKDKKPAKPTKKAAPKAKPAAPRNRKGPAKPKLKHPLSPELGRPKPEGENSLPPPMKTETTRVTHIGNSVEVRKKVTPVRTAVPTRTTGATATTRSPGFPSTAQRTDTAPHLIVKAGAGTGKTTTMVCGLRVMRGLPPTVPIKDEHGQVVGEREITPSDEQRAVWDALALSGGNARSVCFCAFNKPIAEELERRVPPGCKAMTLHKLGFLAVLKHFGNVRLNSGRVEGIILDLLGIGPKPEDPHEDDPLYKAKQAEIKEWWEKRNKKGDVIFATKELVGKCKMNLVGYDGLPRAIEPPTELWNGWLSDLARHYDIDLNGGEKEVFDLVPRALEACKDVARDNTIDFNDMIWLPVALNLPVFVNDLLIVDEAQDLNRCQQELAKRAGKRLVFVGDPRQAIYGFAGADAESMDRLEKELANKSVPHPDGGFRGDGGRGLMILPLMTTRRCGKAIVKEAQKIVPEYQAHESNGEGLVSVSYMEPTTTAGGAMAPTYRERAKPGDMILCRVNAPLVSECFRFIKAGRKASIVGRNIGDSLVATVKKLKAKDVADLISRLGHWAASEVTKEQAKKFPDENRIIAINDRHDCIVAFTAGLQATDKPELVIAKIDQVFTDDRRVKGIVLSSIHKAKGLEADTVFLLEPKGATVPHPMAKTAWQIEQEWNLRYVAITRAIKELVYVT